MGFQSVPDCAEVVLAYHTATAEFRNVLHCAHGGGYSPSDLQNLADAVDDWAGAYFTQCISTTTTYDGVFVRGLEFANDYTAYANANAGVGSGAGTPLPANVAAVITFKSGVTGRSARGRCYIGGIGATAQASNTDFSAAYASIIHSSFGQLPTSLIGTGWTHVVVSRRFNNAPRITGVYFTIVDYVVKDNRFDSQRRRLGQ